MDPIEAFSKLAEEHNVEYGAKCNLPLCQTKSQKLSIKLAGVSKQDTLQDRVESSEKRLLVMGSKGGSRRSVPISKKLAIRLAEYRDRFNQTDDLEKQLADFGEQYPELKSEVQSLFSGEVKSARPRGVEQVREVGQRVSEKRWRLVIRVNPPDSDGAPWRCELCGSLGSDLSVVYRIYGEEWSTLSASDQEKIIKAIREGREEAQELWEPLRRIALPQTRWDVTTEEIVALLEVADQLREDGVFIQWPSLFLREPRQHIKRKIAVTDGKTQREPAGLTGEAIFRFQIALAIDDETLTLEELNDLVQIREPLVKLRGKWVYVDAKLKSQLIEQVQQIAEASGKPLTVEQAVGKVLIDELRSSSMGDEFPSEIQLESDELKERVTVFQRQSPPNVGIPLGLKATLRDYQEVGFRWLAMMGSHGLGGCLADDMGLGKTVQTLAWLLHRRDSGIKEPALLVCPTSVMSNWEREAKKFVPELRLFRYHGPNRPKTDREFFAAVRSAHLVVTSYPLLQRNQNLFQNVSWKWSAVILDEAQNIKNADTEQSKAARGLSTCSMARLALTGTPVENRATDLWPLMDFLNPGMLGELPQFSRWASAVNGDDGELRRSELSGKLKPFVLRRLKTDSAIVPELPEKIENTVWCPLTRQQAGWYKAVLNQAKNDLNSDSPKDRSGAILKILPMLKQICNGVSPFQKDGSDIDKRSGKIERLGEMLVSVVEAKEKAIVFSQYPGLFNQLAVWLMDRLRSDLRPPVRVLTLDGNDTLRDREERQKDFNQDSRFPVLLVSLRAGGAGLNLQAANHVFHFDRWWNAAVEDQATDRAHRIGQERIVHVHKFICPGTLEERIDELISKKRKLAGDLLEDVEEVGGVVAQLAQLDSEGLLNVLHLDEDKAVVSDDEV